MDIVIYDDGKPWSGPKLDAFAEGLLPHHIMPHWRKSGDWRVSDIAVVWGHRDSELHRMQREAGARYLVLERGYIGDIHKRREFTSIGYDGLNGRADFRNRNSPSDRWEKHFAGVMKPWRSGGDYALIMGQVPGDASHEGVDLQDWYEEAAVAVGFAWNLPACFRPHPVAVERGLYREVSGAPVMSGSLTDALEHAAVVATWNSNSGVDAVLSGVPTIARDEGSMAWDVSARSYDELAMPDRTQWAWNLAYCQWTETEMRSGEAWEHLRP